MKTRFLIGISIVAAFIIGYMAGGIKSTRSWVRIINHNAYQSYASDVSTDLMALNAFRRGDEKGCANILENSLEGSLFALNRYSDAMAKQPDISISQSIKDARVYRAKYPWEQANAKMTDDVEQTMIIGVNHVLSLAK